MIGRTQKRRTPTSGGELAYVDEGEGPAVLLLHGFPQSSHAWRDVIPAMATRFRTIAPDLLGAGDSDKPDQAPLGLVAQAAYVRELLERLGVPRFAVVGHGLGGSIAQLLSLEGGVEAAVLIDSAPLDASSMTATAGLAAVPFGREGDGHAGGVRSILRAGMRRPERLSEEHIAEYLRPFAGPDGGAAFARLASAVGRDGLAGQAPDLGSIVAPVLIFWGEEDAFVPVELAHRLNDAIPTSTLGLFPGCGHFLLEDAAETVVPMLYEYLRAMYLKAPHGHVEGVVAIQLERRPPWIDLPEEEEREEDG